MPNLPPKFKYEGQGVARHITCTYIVGFHLIFVKVRLTFARPSLWEADILLNNSGCIVNAEVKVIAL